MRNSQFSAPIAMVLVLVAAQILMLFYPFGLASPPAIAAQANQTVTSPEDLGDKFNLSSSWTQTVQGHFNQDGACVYEFSYDGRLTGSSPVVAMQKSIDPITCTVVIQLGIPTDANLRPLNPGGSTESGETFVGNLAEDHCDHTVVEMESSCRSDDPPPATPISTFEIVETLIANTPGAQESNHVEVAGVGGPVAESAATPPAFLSDMSPGGPLLASASSGRDAGSNGNPRYSHLNHKLTFWVYYDDPAYIDVSGVSVAVRSNTSGSQMVGAACLHQRHKFDPTGWRQSNTDPRFNVWGCEFNDYWASSVFGAHHYNNDFPLCFGDTVHIYYYNVYAAVNTLPGYNEFYQIGWSAVWKSGAENTCGPLLSDIPIYHWVPEEYYYEW